MGPKRLSRHRFTRGIRDASGALVLSLALPFRYVDRADNIVVTVSEGDSLFTLAGRWYDVIDPARACGLWWIIADFQPDPIFDPTCRLEVGSTLILPSPSTVLTEIFAESRRSET